MQTNKLRRASVAALVTLLAACGTKSSSTGGPEGGPVPTSRMTIRLSVESTEPGKAVVRVNLNDGKALGSTYVLDGGDYLRACVLGTCHNLYQNDSLSSPDYLARFDFQPGVDYVLSFNRQEAQGAPNSRVVLPPDFFIVTPANHQQVTDGDSVLVSWTPSGAPANVALSYAADCTYLSGAHGHSGGMLNPDSNGDGQEAVRIDPIIDSNRTTVPSTITRCSIDVTVSHELLGRLDPAFRTGTAVGVVSRTVNLDYIPR